MAHYDIWVARSTGERIGLIDRFVALTWYRELNGAGMAFQPGSNVLPMTLTLARADCPLPIGRDTIIEIWRNGVLETESVWLVQRVRKVLTSTGRSLVEIGAVPAVAILQWRTIPYAAGTAQTRVDGPADDAMIDVVYQNFGADAAPERRLSKYLQVEAKQGRGPMIQKGFARWSVLRVLQDIADISTQAGTPLFFDVVYRGTMPLTFRTYIHARGTDRTATVTLAPDFGTLANVEHTIDYEDEVTAVYALGQGAFTERLSVEVVDQVRIDQSVFGRREKKIDARHLASKRELTSEAQAALVAGRPREDFRASLVSRPGMAYGSHVRLGDTVMAAYDGHLFACRIDSVTVTVDEEGREQVNATLRKLDARLISADRRAEVRAEETENTYHQVHGAHLPQDAVVMVPEGGVLQVPMEYTVNGVLAVGAGAKVIHVA